MEKKIYLWIALIVGIPLIRVVEVVSIGTFMHTPSAMDLLKHAFIGLVIGTGCALSAQIMKLSGRQVLWVLPLLALGYATMLLGFTYPRAFFHMDLTFVSNALLLDLGAWFIAVTGAAVIGFVATRPRTATEKAVTPIASR